MSYMSNSSSVKQDRNMVMCDCGLNARVRTSWTSKNPGRRFVSCQKIKVNCFGEMLWFKSDNVLRFLINYYCILLLCQDERSCNFFMWMDEEMCGRTRNLIYELNQRNVMLEDNILKLEEKLCKMKTKTKLIKKIKQTQNFLLYSVLLCMFGIIVGLVVSKEMTSRQMKFLP